MKESWQQDIWPHIYAVQNNERVLEDFGDLRRLLRPRF